MNEMGKKSRWIVGVILLIVAVLSITMLGPKLSTIETYDKAIEILDNKKLNATTISTMVTAASVAISFLPEDKGTPLAEELADFSAPLLLVVCALQLEKFMLTTFGGTAAYVMLPLACLLYIISLIFGAAKCREWGTKVFLLALLLALIIPTSIRITQNVEDTHAASISNSFEKISSFGSTFDHTTIEEDEGFFTKLFKGIAEGISDALTTMKELLTIVIDAVAVLVITSCIIPLLTLLIFVWLVKLILTGKSENFGQPYVAFKNKVSPVTKKMLKAIHEMKEE
ncbi:MAG: hypothetical protein IKT57_00320 [Clostridia bacterium]|nr:hypothetical protein [Clostridia bacterium]